MIAFSINTFQIRLFEIQFQKDSTLIQPFPQIFTTKTELFIDLKICFLTISNQIGKPRGIDFLEVQRTLFNIPGVIKVHNLRIWSLSLDKTALSAHLAIGLNNWDIFNQD